MILRNFEHTYSVLGCVVFVLMCISACIQKADAQEILWKKTFDTGWDDFASDVCSDSFGNVIVTGTTYGGVNNYHDWLTIKYNKNGDTVWTRRFDNSSYDIAYGIATDRWGNIIVAGETHTDSTGCDYCIVKYSPQGDVIWLRTLSTDSLGMGEAHSVAVDSKGNIIVTGTSTFPPAVTVSPDYVTVKYDTAGTLLWMRVYNYAYEDIAQCVTVDDSDNIIVTGYSTDSSQSYNWDWCTIKYSSSGDTLWMKREDVGRDDRAYSTTIDRSSNGVLVAGGLGKDGTIVKYNGTTRSELWRKNFNWVGLIVGISTDNNHNIYFTSLYTPLVYCPKRFSTYINFRNYSISILCPFK
ncbi:MAG: hypothetical protein QME52_00570 [Bacteroidota bacterium]|nr:hypothetical protein [Bacteroidota bacterium]